MIKTLLKSIREYKRPAIMSFLAIVGEVIIECLIPFITADLIEKIQQSVEMGELVRIGLTLVLMAFVSLGCGGYAGYVSAKAAAGFAKNLRTDMFDRIQNFSFENIDRFSSASLVTRMTTDVNNAQMSFMMVIRTAVRSPLMFIFAIVMAARMGGKLALTFVVVIPVLAAGLFLVSRKAMPAFHRVFKKYDKLNQSVEENVRGMRVVKGFSREDYEKQKFGRAAEEIRADFTKAERIVAFNNPLMQACLYFNMVFILAVGSRLVITGTGGIGVGQLSAMLTYGFQVLMSLMMLSMIYVILTISLESMRRIAEVLNEESTLKNPDDPVKKIPDGSIELENVNFKYAKNAQNYALEGVNLSIKSGMTVGVIGGTGSGKSTLVQLIPRLYDVTDGSISVGGLDVRKYDISALRDSVAMVLQKNQLFSGTIKDNLRWGNEGATDDELVEACRLAQADSFITAFPDGYDTYIEQGGTNVSGGQKQRLCIARALLKKPKILILDDSTSAVDTKTDALIRMGFKQYIPETTKIIIAQRIASVQDADLIVILDNGRVVSQGTHDELLRTSPIYREIYEEQTTGRDDDE
ncbi:MAG: ABC transporter ATP-binding protein/permease [Clostridiales bacterium]|nr:ABC transporter ATP-binding protein/permease [Clostridiales bacterium]